MIAHAPTAADVEEGKLTKHLFFASPDAPPWPDVPDGPDGAGGYRFTQRTLADTWVIEHNLGFYPEITVQNTIGQEQLAVATFASPNELTIRFSEACMGPARLTPPER